MRENAMSDISRRTFLSATGLTLAGCATPPRRSIAPLDLVDEARRSAATFFTRAELDFISAAVERLIPTDALGPGAISAGVPLFIDRQLAGGFGQAVTWYMQGPWQDGTDEQGYQSKLTPAQLYRQAISDIDKLCREQHGKLFSQLNAAEQDALLSALEKGNVNLENVSAKGFFKLLLQNAQEGFLADPMYGGNRHFIGWKLIGFPGPRYNYTSEIERYGQPYTEPTVGILGRDENIDGKV